MFSIAGSGLLLVNYSGQLSHHLHNMPLLSSYRIVVKKSNSNMFFSPSSLMMFGVLVHNKKKKKKYILDNITEMFY
jgi:hypothetical protein